MHVSGAVIANSPRARFFLRGGFLNSRTEGQVREMLCEVFLAKSGKEGGTYIVYRARTNHLHSSAWKFN
eukprot:7027921-Heterocapsa_arctica.AAC.1